MREREEIFDVECVCEWREWRERERDLKSQNIKHVRKKYKTFL